MAKKAYFGTDGVRGCANKGKMTPDMVMRLGMAAGKHFRNGGTRRHSVVIGKDTRLSGYMIEPALVAGFASVGMDVSLFGPLPTSGVSLMTRTLRADLGVMITASHNQYHDNGIKFFGPDGCKLHDDVETIIEDNMDSKWKEGLAAPESLGRVRRLEDVQASYIEIVNAAYKTAPATFWELGADEVITIGTEPNGMNINANCGSTSTDRLASTVLKHGADMGIALDGDADRLIMCDEKGQIIDGDQLLALIATGWAETGRLHKPGLVATVMSNLGLERYLQDQKMDLIRTSVGDRNVAARMRAEGYNVGGEQSGHILMTDYSPTGDGTMAALQVVAEIIRSGRPASEVLKVFEAVPQVLKNVRFEGNSPMEHKDVIAVINDAKVDLGNSGRILVRPSGTEPLIRVMAEGDDYGQIDKVTNSIVAVIESLAA